MGANLHLKNVYGANVLHIAAQGDCPAPIYYYVRIKNMSLENLDLRGSTPLHWACFARSEFALTYILALRVNMERKDNAGYTPLHLAIK